MREAGAQNIEEVIDLLSQSMRRFWSCSDLSDDRSHRCTNSGAARCRYELEQGAGDGAADPSLRVAEGP